MILLERQKKPLDPHYGQKLISEMSQLFKPKGRNIIIKQKTRGSQSQKAYNQINYVEDSLLNNSMIVDY
jgi:hypothetical protein